MKLYQLATECFFLKEEGAVVAYFPQKTLALRINGAMAELLERLRGGVAPARLTSAEQEPVAQLVRAGLARVKPVDYRPTHVTLLLTTACNLRCVYCHSDGGGLPARTISPAACRAAIDLVVANAKAKKARCRLTLHGGGEPTCAWETLVQSVRCLEDSAGSAGLGYMVSLSTNGVIPPGHLEWLVQHIPDIQISLDGPADIQDRQRPKSDGRGSHGDVAATMDFLERRGHPFHVRTTVTGESVPTLTRFVEELAHWRKCANLHLEPMFEAGRGAAGAAAAPAAEDFVREYRGAVRRGRELGLKVWYSGARVNRANRSYCGVSDPMFCVTPEENVTACYEVANPADPRAEFLFYGRFDRAIERFEFDPLRIDRLRSRVPANLAPCRSCFCKYTCAGDCAAKAPAPGEVNGYRCRINQILSQDSIMCAVAASPAAPGEDEAPARVDQTS